MPDDAYLIWSFEHNGWWRPGGWGYSPYLADAGLFTRNEASTIVQEANVVTVNERAVRRDEAATWTTPPSFVCPTCRRRSFNPNDLAHRYCPACHQFHESL